MSATTDPDGRRRAERRQLSLFDPAPGGPAASLAPREPVDPDGEARAFAVDPRHHVVLEASAGTGKTSVLVTRYINLLNAGIDPANILAITFTRKAAAEMRERIVRELRAGAERSDPDRARWLELRDRLGDIAISTIDAFCLSLLREFPLEADVDPAFELADDTEVPRLVATALDRTLRIVVALARTDGDVALVLAQLGIARTRQGLAHLLDRRLVAGGALDRFLARTPRDLTSAQICLTTAAAMRDVLESIPGGPLSFLADGPHAHPRYALFLRAVEALGEFAEGGRSDPATTRAGETIAGASVRAVLDPIAAHFLTQDGRARRAGAIAPYRSEHYATKEAARRHREALFGAAPRVEAVMFAFARDLNVVLVRGVRRMFAVATAQYRTALEERSVLDFSDVLERALHLLRRMDEFSQSRFRLESRYHHVLVDEFQDTSRAQWELVSLLIQAWGEGAGVAASPSIFIVGDRKQSIYRFRDADVSVLRRAGHYIDALRPGSRSRRAISRSFRAVPELQRFVNDLFADVSQAGARDDEFTYHDRDRFPVEAPADGGLARSDALGLAVCGTADACAASVGDEIVALLQDSTVRDRQTGIARQTRPGDIAILFRSRSSHREFERELGARGVPTYVYKGLGFFDADEIKDLTALIRYLADPSSPLRAAAFLRSSLIRLSDQGLAALGSDVPALLLASTLPGAASRLDAEDQRVIALARQHVPLWLARVDRTTPAELLDAILAESAYAWELRGPRTRQAWENLKKIRGLVRRIQNRGYLTMRRLAGRLESLSAGDESNAVIEAMDAVNLMTVHASKGLEFPVVFVVNLAKGAIGPPQPVRVVAGMDDGEDGEGPSITVGSFLSESDEAERDRDRHETRRLLYVALTRARDRLYLSSSLKDGALVAGRGSLAEILPESFRTLLEGSAALPHDVERTVWRGASGFMYRWRLCRPAPALRRVAMPASYAPSAQYDFEAPPSTPRAPRPAGDTLTEAGERHAHGAEPADRLLGRLVHRLFEIADGPESLPDVPVAAAAALRLVRPDEYAGTDDVERLATRAAEVWFGALQRPDVAAALSGERRHEVPFTLSLPAPVSRMVRGVIDCVIRKPDGTFLVVEVKTGRPHPEHQRQLDLYVRAMRALQPEARVDGVVLYV